MRASTRRSRSRRDGELGLGAQERDWESSIRVTHLGTSSVITHLPAAQADRCFPSCMGRSDLERLSKEELIEPVLRLQRPEKTSRTSSNQTCLAHLARDVAYAVEVSEDPVPWRLQLWLNTG